MAAQLETPRELNRMTCPELAVEQRSEVHAGTALAMAGPPNDLDALVARANRAHDSALHALRAGVTYAIEAGEALILAKAQIPRGAWEPWLDQNFNGTPGTARQYIRLATYRDSIPETLHHDQRAAMTFLRGLPSTDGTNGKATMRSGDPATWVLRETSTGH